MSPVWRKTPLEKGKAIQPSILTWRVPWTVEPGGLSPWCREEPDTTERPSTQHWGIKRPEARGSREVGRMLWVEGRMQSGLARELPEGSRGAPKGGSVGALQAVWTSSPGHKPRDAKPEVPWTEASPAGLPGRSRELGTGQTGDLPSPSCLKPAGPSALSLQPQSPINPFPFPPSQLWRREGHKPGLENENTALQPKR